MTPSSTLSQSSPAGNSSAAANAAPGPPSLSPAGNNAAAAAVASDLSPPQPPTRHPSQQQAPSTADNPAIDVGLQVDSSVSPLIAAEDPALPLAPIAWPLRQKGSSRCRCGSGNRARDQPPPPPELKDGIGGSSGSDGSSGSISAAELRTVSADWFRSKELSARTAWFLNRRAAYDEELPGRWEGEGAVGQVVNFAWGRCRYGLLPSMVGQCRACAICPAFGILTDAPIEKQLVQILPFPGCFIPCRSAHLCGSTTGLQLDAADPLRRQSGWRTEGRPKANCNDDRG